MDDKKKIAKIIEIIDEPYLYTDASDKLSDIRTIALGDESPPQVVLNPGGHVTQWRWGEAPKLEDVDLDTTLGKEFDAAVMAEFNLSDGEWDIASETIKNQFRTLYRIGECP